MRATGAPRASRCLSRPVQRRREVGGIEHRDWPRQAGACRASRARRSDVPCPADVTELGFLAYESGREARRPKGQRGRMSVQCGAGSTSGLSGTSSPDAPIEPGTPEDCETSTNPIVLVSRVTTGAPRSLELRLRVWNDGRFPLPFTVTIPVSFERWRRWWLSVEASTVSSATSSIA